MRFTPASSAAWIVRIERSTGGREESDIGIPPRPIGNTSASPSLRVLFMPEGLLRDKIATHATEESAAVYDYVIVGAGSAGCVLANRLSEDPDVKVLLVEAGPPDTADFIHIPAAFSALFRTQHDWDHMTGWEPGANNRRIYLP